MDKLEKFGKKKDGKWEITDTETVTKKRSFTLADFTFEKAALQDRINKLQAELDELTDQEAQAKEAGCE